MRFSANIGRLQPSATMAVSALAKRLASEGRDIVDLSAGEPDFDTPAWISEAGIEAIRAGKTRYTPPAGIPELRKAVAAEATERAGREVDWNGVVVTNGAKQALFNACFALFGPGDEVLVGAPYWTSYPEIVTLARADAVAVAGSEERNFLLTTEELEAARTERTRGLILCSPSNPTGAVYGSDDLKTIAEWCLEHDIVLVSDEIYRMIEFGEEGSTAPGILSLPEDSLGEHVVIDGVSKSCAMTGWRIGFSISSPRIARELGSIQSHTTSNASSPAQWAAHAAYADLPRWRAEVERMRAAYRGRKELVVELFRRHLPRFTFAEPSGAFYLFVRVDAAFAPGEGSSEFCSRVLEATGVALVPGVAFGDDRYARLSYATSEERIREAVRRLEAVHPSA